MCIMGDWFLNLSIPWMAFVVFAASHIEEAVNREWPAMAHQRLKLATLPTAMVEALQLTVSLKPQDESQRIGQREMVPALHRAADARRQRIILSQSTVGPVKWAAILLQGLCALIAIAMVHSDNRLTCVFAWNHLLEEFWSDRDLARKGRAISSDQE